MRECTLTLLLFLNIRNLSLKYISRVKKKREKKILYEISLLYKRLYLRLLHA